MKKNEKIFISTLIILIIILLAIIGILLATNIKNKNIIQKQVSEVQKLAETSGENSFITTADHLAEVNSSVESIWESIRNSETLSSKTDSSGNPIYGSVTDIASLEAAITAGNDNAYNEGKNYQNFKYYKSVAITSKVNYTQTNPLVLTGVDFEPNVCFMHQTGYTSYGSAKNFDIVSPAGHSQYMSDTYFNINRSYNAEAKTYTMTFSSAAPNNRWTGTWEVLLARIE